MICQHLAYIQQLRQQVAVANAHLSAEMTCAAPATLYLNKQETLIVLFNVLMVFIGRATSYQFHTSTLIKYVSSLSCLLLLIILSDTDCHGRYGKGASR